MTTSIERLRARVASDAQRSLTLRRQRLAEECARLAARFIEDPEQLDVTVLQGHAQLAAKVLQLALRVEVQTAPEGSPASDYAHAALGAVDVFLSTLQGV